jgi:ribosomal protein S18 acetylase RimI-like enzyme
VAERVEPVETVIRAYQPADYEAVSEVCVRTAEVGGDARGLYVSDELMPDNFVRPYVRFAPELAFVVDDGAVGGYVVGVADTRAFVEWFRRAWLPGYAATYEHVEPWTTKNELIIHLGYWPERMLIPEVDEYPAHLHIDMLPRLQGQGWGRALIENLKDALRARGVPGLHLTMDAANTAARAFYDRLGFTELPSNTVEVPVLGIRL